MPGPGNSRIPTLSTMPEIGRFCNPTTATSTAVICNSLLRSVILELLENAKVKAFDEGKKEGYYEGYEEGSYLASENKENDVFEMLRKEDEEKVWSTTLEGRQEVYKRGLREGEEKGRTAEREKWETKRERTKVNESVQTESTTRETTDMSTQTTPTSVNAAMQTVQDDELPRLLNNAGMSIELCNTCETAVQTDDSPQPTLLTSSPPNEPTRPATSPLATAPSAPSMTPTTSTTTSFPASKQLPAPHQRRHSLPSQPTAPLQPLQPFVSRPEPPIATATSFSTTATNLAATTIETTTRVSTCTQTAADTPETINEAINNADRPSTAQQANSRDDEQTRSSKHIVYSTEPTLFPPEAQTKVQEAVYSPQLNPAQSTVPRSAP